MQVTKSWLTQFHDVIAREQYELWRMRDKRLREVLVEIDELKRAVERALDALDEADPATE